MQWPFRWVEGIVFALGLHMGRPVVSLKQLILILLLAVSGFPANGGNTCVDHLNAVVRESEFNEVQRISEHILDRFPPNQYVYVGIGRSPTLFAAYIKATHPDAVFSVPLTNFHKRPETHWLDRKLNIPLLDYDAPLDLEHRNKLFAHFDRFLPSQAMINSRKILLIDFAFTGGSLLSAYEYLELYYQTNKITQEIQPMAIAHPGAELEGKMKKFARVYLRGGSLMNLMMRHQFDSYAEYGAYLISRTANTELPRNAEFDVVVEWMRSQKDKAASLKSTGGSLRLEN